MKFEKDFVQREEDRGYFFIRYFRAFLRLNRI